MVFPCVFIMNSISQAKQHHVLAPIVINLRNNFSKWWSPFIAEHLSNVSIFSHFIPRCINCCLNGGGRRFIFFSSKNIFILSTFQWRSIKSNDNTWTAAKVPNYSKVLRFFLTLTLLLFFVSSLACSICLHSINACSFFNKKSVDSYAVQALRC